MSRFKQLVQELRRRKVFRVAVVYAVVAFVIWQVAVLSHDDLRAVYQVIQRRIAEEVPIIFVAEIPRIAVVGPRLRGVKVGINGPFASVAEWWVASSEQ